MKLMMGRETFSKKSWKREALRNWVESHSMTRVRTASSQQGVAQLLVDPDDFMCNC